MRGATNIERGIAGAAGAALAALLAVALLASTADASSRRATKIWVLGSGTITKPQVVVRAKPKDTAPRVKVLKEFRADFSPQYVVALSALQHKTTGKATWYRISLPGRPNGRTGWIRAESVVLTPMRTEIVVRRGARILEVREGGRLRLRARVVVGAPGMETPLGLFYVTAKFRPADPFLGSYAFETSAYSRLSDWPGGGVVGIHGTPLTHTIGKNASNGCIRVHNSTVLRLRRIVPLGTPVKVVR